MPEFNHYHCNDCDDAWTTGETTEQCPVCRSTHIHEVEFDEIGVAKWRLWNNNNDRVAALRR
jgi:Zn finger protein HypA/HybF involved in hydrogenase expression